MMNYSRPEVINFGDALNVIQGTKISPPVPDGLGAEVTPSYEPEE